MLKRPSISKALCILTAALFAWKLFLMWSPDQGQYPEVNETGALTKVRDLRPVNITREEKPGRFAYEMIARKNLFNPKRRERWEIKKKPKPLPPPPRPKVKKAVRRPKIVRKPTLVLEGVIIFGGYRAGLVRDVARPSEGVKRVHAGDSIGVFKVDSIEEKALTLMAEDGTKIGLTLFSSELGVRRKHVKTGVSRTRSKINKR